MNGFGFVEYKDALDARDVVPGNFPTPHFLLTDFASASLWTISLTRLFSSLQLSVRLGLFLATVPPDPAS